MSTRPNPGGFVRRTSLNSFRAETSRAGYGFLSTFLIRAFLMSTIPLPTLERGAKKKINASDLGGVGSWSVHAERLAGGIRDNVDVVTIDTGRLKVAVLPTRGMGIWKAWLGDWEVGWKSPVPGPVHPAFVNLGEPSGLGWIDGFDEMFVRCGLESNGAPDFDPKTNRLAYPLHGRIANKPASQVEISFDSAKKEIAIKGTVDEIRFHFLKLRMTSTISVRLDSNEIQIHDRVENLSGSKAETQMLYHVNFGIPLLDAGSRVVAPFKTVVPRNAHAASGIDRWDNYPAPQAGFEEQVYFTEVYADDHGETLALLKNAHGMRGVSFAYSVKQFPYLSVWKNPTSEADGYVTGIEPGTNFPNPRSFETKKGRVVTIEPHGVSEYRLSLGLLDQSAEILKTEAAIASIQKGRTTDIARQPRPEWCA